MNDLSTNSTNSILEKAKKKDDASTVNYLLFELKSCNNLIKMAQKKNTSISSERELIHHAKIMHFQLRKKRVLLERLSKLGCNVDRRGSPRKEKSENYKSNHVRFSCYFSPINIIKLKTLKVEGNINNISSFLNDLVDSYFNTEVGCDTIEK